MQASLDHQKWIGLASPFRPTRPQNSGFQACLAFKTALERDTVGGLMSFIYGWSPRVDPKCREKKTNACTCCLYSQNSTLLVVSWNIFVHAFIHPISITCPLAMEDCSICCILPRYRYAKPNQNNQQQQIKKLNRKSSIAFNTALALWEV